ncbi:MAG: cytochrome c biogenesis protein CcmG/thiol:disulfide interchange protein DsbE [Oleiphilaceae bacterium]|jgi:cytochrome c biogenesis protein CcmG/thiol:disulfide interchange protein DsbE
MKKVLLLVGCVLLNTSSMFALAEIKPESDVMASAPLSILSIGADKIDFSDYRGKVVLLDFWASWCGPCRQSFLWMNEIQAKYTDQGLVVIAVNLDQEKQAAADFLAAVPATFKILYDPDGGSAEQMEVMGMPMSYLIDRQGKLRHRLIGFNSSKKQEHEEHIVALLYETSNETTK